MTQHAGYGTRPDSLPEAVECVIEAARQLVADVRDDCVDRLHDDVDVLEVALWPFLLEATPRDDPPATAVNLVTAGADSCAGEGGGSSVGVASGCGVEGHAAVRDAGDSVGRFGAPRASEVATDDALTRLPNDVEANPEPTTSDRAAGIKPGHSLVTPAWAEDAEHDALVDLLLACGLMLERRDPQGRGAARARLRESMAAAQQALGLDAPPVVKCTPVRPEVTLRGEE